jgi:hypothetical protein
MISLERAVERDADGEFESRTLQDASGNRIGYLIFAEA